jgi:hypothetical protein
MKKSGNLTVNDIQLTIGSNKSKARDNLLTHRILSSILQISGPAALASMPWFFSC